MTKQTEEKTVNMNQVEDQQEEPQEQQHQEREQDVEASEDTQQVRSTHRVATKPPTSPSGMKMLSLSDVQPLQKKRLSKPRRKLAEIKGNKDIRAFMMRGKVTQGEGGEAGHPQGAPGRGVGEGPSSN